MDDLIARLRSYGDPNPPCTPERIEKLTAELGFEIDPFLLALYAHFNGQRHTWRMVADDAEENDQNVGFRLMPVDEVIELHRIVQDREEHQWPTFAFCMLWADDQSNYMAVHTDGPLRGRVCIFQHDGDWFLPQFRSSRSFCAALAQVVDAGEGYEPGHFADYPIIVPPRDGDDAADTAIALRLIAECRAEEDRDQQEYLAECAASLLPYHDADLLLSLSRDENELIRKHVNALLGARDSVLRQRAGIPRLAELLRAGPHAKKSEARRELLDLLRRYGSQAGALESLGVEVQAQRKGWRYRASPGAEWEFLPR